MPGEKGIYFLTYGQANIWPIVGGGGGGGVLLGLILEITWSRTRQKQEWDKNQGEKNQEVEKIKKKKNREIEKIQNETKMKHMKKKTGQNWEGYQNKEGDTNQVGVKTQGDKNQGDKNQEGYKNRGDKKQGEKNWTKSFFPFFFTKFFFY